ncbi:MAG: GTPase ObgE [Clostridia bacterium]|nr:GTPase ObgE [Clostridia bacterium]
MLLDVVKIYVKAGNGGNGCVSFHREKYVSHGGPDGGDGGNGGNVILRIDEGDNTLLRYKYSRKFVAENGGDGKSDKFHGKNGEDIILPVPPGTVVKDASTGRIIKDMTDCGDFVLCRGGRGGWGNRHFATPTRQIPRFAKAGTSGQELEVTLELKMIADAALIGMPNVGKSSLLSVMSSARPKIADYEFTTLSPNLGVVSVGEGSGYVIADIPGLIEGASEGRGLGHTFLRHIDRCRMFIHVVDISADCERSPAEDIEKITGELGKYDPSLTGRPVLLVGNKYDVSLAEYNEHVAELENYASERGLPLLFTSAATGYNVEALKRKVGEMLRDLPKTKVFEPEEVPATEVPDKDELNIYRDGSVTVCEAEWLYRLLCSVNFSDRDSMSYFQRMLRKNGVIDALEEFGVKDGDTVRMFDLEFDFWK